MKDGCEQLSLAEVEALAGDALARSGLDPAAAPPVAWAICAAERQGDRDGGLARLPRLLEGLRTGAIQAGAQPQASAPHATQISVAAGSGLSDVALSVGVEALRAGAHSNGMARLIITGTGDIAHPRPWLAYLAEQHGIASVALGGAPDGLVSSDDAAQTLLPTSAIAPLRAALAEPNTGWVKPVANDYPYLEPVNGSLLILAIAQIPSDPAASARQVQADSADVHVPSDLLLRILNA